MLRTAFGECRIIREPKTGHRKQQAKHLQVLLAQKHLSAREIARRSVLLATRFQDPELRVGHQAVSQWVNGSLNPAPRHRWLLAQLLDVSLASINAACDSDFPSTQEAPILKTLTLQVEGKFQSFRYDVVLKAGVDLTKPAIYRRWSEILASWPGSLGRHFKSVDSELFGWVPDDRASPIVSHSRAMVPVGIPGRRLDRLLGTANSSQRHVWFVYLPGGELDAGIGYRERRTFFLAKNNSHGIVIQQYPLPRVELVGYFCGQIVFRAVSSSNENQSAAA